jgi:SAM-dependent methyltransferase
VIGLDRNREMLALARWAAPIVADKIGYANVSFREAAIEDLGRDLSGLPLLADASVDVVLSNCVLNLVRPDARSHLLREIRRVLRPGGRVAISDIVSDRTVPLDLQQDPELWSGCISGAWQEDRFLEDFRALGFEGVHYADRQERPWRELEGIAFRAVTLVGHRPGAAPESGCC